MSSRKLAASLCVSALACGALFAADVPSTPDNHYTDTISVTQKTLTLKEGWNLVSLPGYSSKEINTLFNSSKIETIWAYNSSGWLAYTPNGDNKIGTVDPTQGFWVKVASGSSYTLVVYPPSGVSSSSSSAASAAVIGGCSKVSTYFDSPYTLPTVFNLGITVQNCDNGITVTHQSDKLDIVKYSTSEYGTYTNANISNNVAVVPSDTKYLKIYGGDGESIGLGLIMASAASSSRPASSTSYSSSSYGCVPLPGKSCDYYSSTEYSSAAYSSAAYSSAASSYSYSSYAYSSASSAQASTSTTISGFAKPSQSECTSNGGSWDSSYSECGATWDNGNKICASRGGMPTKEQWLDVFKSCGANTTLNSSGYYGGTYTFVNGLKSCMNNKGFTSGFPSYDYWSSSEYSSTHAWYAGYGGDDYWYVDNYYKTSSDFVRCAL